MNGPPTDTETNSLDNMLTAAVQRKWLYLSNLPNNTTIESVIKYVSIKFKIPSQSIRCVSLVKRNMDTSTLDFVSFRVGILGHDINDVTNISNWPRNIIVRPFESRSKNRNPVVSSITT